MKESIRVSEHVLRLAGLLPGVEAEHHAVRGIESAPQPAIISRVFGEPIITEVRTVIPVASVRFGSQVARDKQQDLGCGVVGGLKDSSPIAVIEVDRQGVWVRGVFDRGPIIVMGLLLGCWNAYWIVRAVREWHSLRASSLIPRKRPVK